MLALPILNLLFVAEFVVIQIKKNVEVSLPLTLASYPPERCRAGRGHKDRSSLVLIESRCPMFKAGTFQGVLLIWHVIIQGACAQKTLQYWFFHRSTCFTNKGLICGNRSKIWDGRA